MFSGTTARISVIVVVVFFFFGATFVVVAVVFVVVAVVVAAALVVCVLLTAFQIFETFAHWHPSFAFSELLYKAAGHVKWLMEQAVGVWRAEAEGE